jgi:hypothetical protein
MHSKINKIIEEWIGEDEVKPVHSGNSMIEASLVNMTNEHNRTLQDLRNKSPQLTEEIVRVVVGEIKEPIRKLSRMRPMTESDCEKDYEEFINLLKK